MSEHSVTQADRIRAADHVRNGLGMETVSQRIERGAHDDHELVQSYAAHRIDAEKAKSSRISELESALRPFAEFYDKRAAIYAKRGGDLNAFPDTHPGLEIRAEQMQLGFWRQARNVLGEKA